MKPLSTVDLNALVLAYRAIGKSLIAETIRDKGRCRTATAVSPNKKNNEGGNRSSPIDYLIASVKATVPSF